MPLRDHFHPRWSERYHWEGFHSVLVNSIVRSLNTTLLPESYRAEPQVAAETALVDLEDVAVYEVRILEDGEESCLVAVLELVSPANKDRPEHRAAFTAKCIAYLRQRVSVIVVDIVTERHANLHQELLRLLTDDQERAENGELYAVAYRSRKEQRQWRVDYWPNLLQVHRPLPTIPLWINAEVPLPLDLEMTYEETIRVLRIH